MPRTALILGASGAFGHAALTALDQAGWTTRRHQRGTDLIADAKGADVIVAGWNPGYPRWAAEQPAQTAQIIAAARASGARVVVPGNVYVYGTEPAPWGPQTPHRPVTALGRIRAQMEHSYASADIPLLTLRLGEFFGPRHGGNWFEQIIAKPVAKGHISYPGAPDCRHAWAYLPDVGRALAGLLAQDLPHQAEIPVQGHSLTGTELAAALSRAAGHPVACRKMSWLPLQIARPVWPLARGIVQMRYLWDHPHQISDGLAQALPGFAPTPLTKALQHAIAPLL